MKKKYNLALIPLSKGNEVVALAQQFSTIADQYILGEKSLPHVTLYQFRAEEKEITQMWQQIGKTWNEKPIDLEFNEFSCITFDYHTFWLSLLPDHRNILHNMHDRIAHILQWPIKKTFDPHMTLINTKNKECEKEVAWITNAYKPIKDTFILSLGTSDDIGQLTEIIYR